MHACKSLLHNGRVHSERRGVHGRAWAGVCVCTCEKGAQVTRGVHSCEDKHFPTSQIISFRCCSGVAQACTLSMLLQYWLWLLNFCMLLDTHDGCGLGKESIDYMQCRCTTLEFVQNRSTLMPVGFVALQGNSKCLPIVQNCFILSWWTCAVLMAVRVELWFLDILWPAALGLHT